MPGSRGGDPYGYSVALMNNQPGFYPTEIRKQDFRRFGVPLLNLRADRSASTCVPDNNFVAPSLQFVKDVGRESARPIVEELQATLSLEGSPVGVSDPVTIQVTVGAKLLRRGGRCLLGGAHCQERGRGRKLSSSSILNGRLAWNENASSWYWSAWDANRQRRAEVQPDLLAARAVSLRENR